MQRGPLGAWEFRLAKLSWNFRVIGFSRLLISIVSTWRLVSERGSVDSKESEIVLLRMRAPESLAVRGEFLERRRFIWQLRPLQ